MSYYLYISFIYYKIIELGKLNQFTESPLEGLLKGDSIFVLNFALYKDSYLLRHIVFCIFV